MSKFTQLSKAVIQDNKNVIISVDDENKIFIQVGDTRRCATAGRTARELTTKGAA